MSQLEQTIPHRPQLSQLDLALSYISHGWPVFPTRAANEVTDQFDQETGEVLVYKAKTPLVSNGFHGATLSERIVRELWRRYPDAAIGIPTGQKTDVFVLDIDVKEEVNGFIWLHEQESIHGDLPKTARATTPSGGMHYYFKYVENTRNRGGMGEGADLRSQGGYVLAPGSVMATGKAYQWIDWDGPGIPPIADAPQWLLDLVVRKTPDSISATPFTWKGSEAGIINSAYVNAAVQSELDETASVPMAGGRNNRLNDAAFALGRFVGSGALAEDHARTLLREVARAWGRDWKLCCDTIERGLKAGIVNPRDVPEPSYSNDNTRLVDLTRMIENGLRKSRALPAAADPQPVSDEPSAPDLQPDVPIDLQPDSPISATPFTWKDPKLLPLREFAFGTHYIRKYVSVTVAPGGLGKTSNSIVEALSMTSGRMLTGTKPQERLRVWLFNAEDPRDELERRIMAACLHYRLKPDDLDGCLFVDSGREQELVVALEDKKTGVKINSPIVEAVVEQMDRNKIDVMIVDPFVSTHGVNENDNGAIDKVAKLWAQIAHRTNAAIDIVHHLRKVGDREGTVEDARGAVSLIGAARSVRVLNRMTADQATQAAVADDQRMQYFSITHGKSNLTPLSHRMDWRCIKGVPLGNGRSLSKPQDFAPVVTEWKWPDKTALVEDVAEDHVALIRVRAANSDYVYNHQASSWIGRMVADVMGIYLQDGRKKTPEHTKIERMIDAWIDAGVLRKEKVKGLDLKHIDREITFVRAA